MTSRFKAQIQARLDLFGTWAKQDMIPWAVREDGSFHRDTDGELIPEYVPLSLPKFCAWGPGLNTGATAKAVENFEPVRRATLDDHEDLRIQVDTARGVMAALLERQIRDKNKTAIIELQKSEIDYLRQVVSAQAKESRLARESEQALEGRFRRRHDEQRRNIAELTEIIQSRDATISELTSTIAKISPLFGSK